MKIKLDPKGDSFWFYSNGYMKPDKVYEAKVNPIHEDEFILYGERSAYVYILKSNVIIVGDTPTPTRIKCVRTKLPNELNDWGPGSHKYGHHVLTINDVYELIGSESGRCYFRGAHHYGGPDHETYMDKEFFEVVPNDTPLHNKHWNNGKFICTPSNPLPPEGVWQGKTPNALPKSDPYTEHRLKLSKQGIELGAKSFATSYTPKQTDNSHYVNPLDLLADDTGPTKYE